MVELNWTVSVVPSDWVLLLPLQVLDSLTSRLDFDLKPYKKYIDNEILVTLAQMDRPSKIFDYLYLVGDSLTKLITLKNFPSLCLTNCQRNAWTRKLSLDLNFLLEGEGVLLYLTFPHFLFFLINSPSPELYFLSFQGSEWNAANFDELQKNKWALWPAHCVCCCC